MTRKIGMRFMLGLQSVPRRGIVNMNHLLFLVELPNNDVYRMDNYCRRHSPRVAEGAIENLRTYTRKGTEHGRL